MLYPFDYCPEDSPSAGRVTDIAACPAAVAASLDRFLSASAKSVNTGREVRWRIGLASFLLSLDVRYNGLNLGEIEDLLEASHESAQKACCIEICDTYGDFSVTFHDADLNILRSSLNNLQQTLHGELDALFPCEIVLVVLLQEFSDSF